MKPVMNDLERQIYETLLSLDRAVRSMATTQPKPNLIPLFTRLDELALQLSKGGDPDLRHYLQRKSYEKARLLLEGRHAENARGSCGH